MRRSPQPGQILLLLPRSTVTCNIYKPLKRINLGASGRAQPPITSTGPPGSVALMDLCGADRFYQAALGQGTLIVGPQVPGQEPRTGHRPRAELGQHFLINTATLLCPRVQATSISFIPRAKKVRLSGKPCFCRGTESQMCCETHCPCHCVAFVYSCSITGGCGAKTMWGILIKESSLWKAASWEMADWRGVQTLCLDQKTHSHTRQEEEEKNVIMKLK